jgi:hypothetical protein
MLRRSERTHIIRTVLFEQTVRSRQRETMSRWFDSAHSPMLFECVG